MIADLSSIPVQTATNVSIIPAGGIVTADVQDAMYGLDGRITSAQSQITGLTSANITDSSTTGRAVLTGTADQALAAINGFSTGDVKLTLKAVADTGWLMMNDSTIGSGLSGATNAGTAVQALYTLLWNNVNNTDAPVSGGRGVNAAADFAANKTLNLTFVLGRSLAVAGSGAGLTTRALGDITGAETKAIAQANLPNVSPTFSGTPATVNLNQGNIAQWGGGQASASAGTGAVNASAVSQITPTVTSTPAGTISALGSGTALNIMQPTAFLNVMIKL